ncbi:hypothetical protein HELRODRAFT_184564 [Helobdella robusta]|uniref:Uncharacterized protein n=1 Tax=Helobdella robusta TaxID=6412 RepID=T1FLH5_HELRO|nr:hypothetical protein HELRODRAFT_184564 [Helobdella robusta]ESO09808.1 hypothetical protein HELRODRAFT_184564 [Helobdella robusta]
MASSENLQSRGNMKIEKILECISLIKQLKENKCWDKCPLFVQFNKVIETVENNKADIISLKNVIKTADINKPEVNTLKNKLNSNVVSDYSTEMTNKEGQKKNVSSSLWSDIAKRNQQQPNKQTGKKTTMKIIGKKVSNDCKLKADKILMKKSVFCLSNVSKCHRNDVMAYLTDNASTADVNNNNSQTENKKTDEEESSTFRVCIDSSDSKKMKDPDIMPQPIIVREWQFNKKPETIVDQTNKMDNMLIMMRTAVMMKKKTI